MPLRRRGAPPGVAGLPRDVQGWGAPIMPGGTGPESLEMPGTTRPYKGTARVLLAFPPEIYPLPGAQEFTVDEDFSSPAAGTVEPAALVFALPQQMKGIIRVAGWGIQNMTAATDVFWTFKVNSGAVQGYTEKRFFPGNVPRITASVDAFIRIPAGGTLSVAFTNVDGAAYTANASYSGWYWSEDEEKQWTGRE